VSSQRRSWSTGVLLFLSRFKPEEILMYPEVGRWLPTQISQTVRVKGSNCRRYLGELGWPMARSDT
jgi:hypothetical protein